MISFPGSPKVQKGAIVGIDIFNPDGMAFFKQRAEEMGKAFAANPIVVSFQMSNESPYLNHGRLCPTDHADAHVCAIEALLEGRSLGVRNLGTGKGHSNREVMAAVARAVGRPVPVQEADRRPGDPPELVADASAFRREFSWKPRHSDLDTIVSTAWEWLQSWKLGHVR